MKDLRARALELQNSLPFMEGRKKGEMQRIVGTTVTITDYGFLQDENEKEYICFVVKEDPENFYFGGAVLTDNMKELDTDGYKEEITFNGLPVFFDKKMSKNKKEYVTVTFYPEPIAKTKK